MGPRLFRGPMKGSLWWIWRFLNAVRSSDQRLVCRVCRVWVAVSLSLVMYVATVCVCACVCPSACGWFWGEPPQIIRIFSTYLTLTLMAGVCGAWLRQNSASKHGGSKKPSLIKTIDCTKTRSWGPRSLFINPTHTQQSVWSVHTKYNLYSYLAVWVSISTALSIHRRI